MKNKKLMPNISTSYYPPLRLRILRSFLWVIFSFITLGFILVSAVFVTSGMTPKLIRVNYDSIAAAQQMREAWVALRHPEEYLQKDPQPWKDQFENALSSEEENITEPGEKEIALQIRSLWNSNKEKTTFTSVEDFHQMLVYLNQVVEVNEKGMFSLASQSRILSQKIFYGSLAFFLLTVLLTIYWADQLSFRLAQPIKNIAEILRSKPSLVKPLKLPEANTLELSILNKQLLDLWDQLSQLNKLNLQQLVAQRNQLETILSSVEDGILVLNNEEKVVLCNEGFALLFGMESESIIYNSWRDLPSLHENYLRLRNFLSPELTTQNSIELNIEGIKIVFAARFRKIYDDQNHPIGSLYLLHDVTQKLGMQRLKEEFISVLSHEIKTPLQSLGMAGELLMNRKEKLDADSQTLVETMNEDISRIRAIANDFIQVGQRETSYLKLNLENLCLNEALQEWIKPFRVLAKDKNIQLQLLEATEKIWVNVDKIKFPWGISNLLSNAIRVSDSGTTIQVSLSLKNQKVCLEVADEGPGISAQAEKNIFEPYYQDSKNKQNTRGFLGIGLTIAKEVVEAHGGKIEYQNRQPTGAIFRIELPVLG
ncbi:MAG: PAS domain S-box protein [Deltaproteobacteria bacterium]|nr:PAS domain S-box protein [Deltaproteobacteria bacterium]